MSKSHRYIFRFITCLLSFLTATVEANEPVDSSQWPTKTLNFISVSRVDRDAGSLMSIQAEAVAEQRIRAESVEVVNAEGKLEKVMKAVTYTVMVPVWKERVMRMADLILTNHAGKRMPLADAANKIELKGRTICLQQDEPDLHYPAFLAPEVLLVVVKGDD